MLYKVTIAAITLDPDSNTPIIILKSETDDRAIPVWIGLLEATAIASALQNIAYERPMTHDLFKNMLTTLNVDVSKVEVCDLKDNTFYAKIHLLTPDKTIALDARPSDAIAIALRFNAPIYVDEVVLEKSKIPNEKVEISDTSEEGKKWAEYLNKLSPDDFGKYKV